MGNNIQHGITEDDFPNSAEDLQPESPKQNSSSSKRKTSASIAEIRNLYSALQELVPSQTRPLLSTAYGAIPKETGSSKSRRKHSGVVEYDAGPKSSDPSLGNLFTKRYRCSSPLPKRSQPKVVQIHRSKSCCALCDSSPSFPVPNDDVFYEKNRRKSSTSSTKSQRIPEELSNIVENFDKEKRSSTRSDNNVSSDSDHADLSSKRRHSVGVLEQHQERVKDPRTRFRRRSIGGSLLLNTLIESRPNRQDSLANALSIIEHKEELQEIFQHCQENLKQEKAKEDGIDESFDEVDGSKVPSEQKEGSHNTDALVSLINKPRKLPRKLSAETFEDSDVKTQARVGAEMHGLLEALQDLVVSGDATPATTSCQSSRRTSCTERSLSPRRQESLNDLEAFFKNKLVEISKKENYDSRPPREATETTWQNSNKSKDFKKNYKNHFRRTSSAEHITGISKRGNSLNVQKCAIQRSQSTIEHKRTLRTRKTSIQFEGRGGRQGRSNSLLETFSAMENKVDSQLNDSSLRRKSDTSIPEQIEEYFDLTDRGEKKRVLWKEDQKVFARQVNKRLEEWLERATALSLRRAVEHTPYNISTLETSVNTRHRNDGAKKEVNPKTFKFVMRKAFKGPINRPKSLHKVLDSNEYVHVRRSKLKSPLIERSKKNLRKLGRLRLPKSKSMLSVDDLQPQFYNIETKSTESDESYGSYSTNTQHSVIWNDADRESPELIAKLNANNAIQSGELDIENPSERLRKTSCPTFKDNNNVMPLDSVKRRSRLPVHLPLFYNPGMDVSNLCRIQTKDEDVYNSREIKDINLPRAVCEGLPGPASKEIKTELFYNGTPVKSQLVPTPLSPPTINSFSATPSPSFTQTAEGHFMKFQSHDMSQLSDSTDFENLGGFRERAKSTESEDSGCPNTSDYS